MEAQRIVKNQHGRLEPASFAAILELARNPAHRHILEASVRAYRPLIQSAHDLLSALCGIVTSPIEQYLLCGFFEVATLARTPIELCGKDFVPGAGVPVVLELQKAIGPYFADFAITDAARVVVECDGAEFHQDKARDARRDKFMEERGWRVMRFTGQKIYHDAAGCASLALEAARG